MNYVGIVDTTFNIMTMIKIKNYGKELLVYTFGERLENADPPNVDCSRTYKILGKLSELQEDQCKEFVHKRIPQGVNVSYYAGYTSNSNWYLDAKKSFISLLESHGVDTSKEQLVTQII